MSYAVLPATLSTPTRATLACDRICVSNGRRNVLTSPYVIHTTGRCTTSDLTSNRDADSQPVLWIPPGASGIGHTFNGARSRLTYCVVDGNRRRVSKPPCLESSEIWTNQLQCRYHRDDVKSVIVSYASTRGLPPTLSMPFDHRIIYRVVTNSCRGYDIRGSQHMYLKRLFQA